MLNYSVAELRVYLNNHKQIYKNEQQFSVSVQFIAISLNHGICEYPYSVEITKI